MIVKVCGITNVDDAAAAVGAGATAIGFNFYPPSPRVVSPHTVWDILRRLPPYVDRIGVYVDWQPKVIAALTGALRLCSIFRKSAAFGPQRIRRFARKPCGERWTTISRERLP